MSDIYERELLLGSEHVDRFRRLRTSTLFELLQTASIRHTEELGMGREKTLDRGLLWVVARQYVKIRRMPEYDERIVIRSWPGETMRVMFPRYFEVLAQNGAKLAQSGAIWMLMERGTRTMAFPDEWGIAISGVKTGEEAPNLAPIRALEPSNSFDFTVPYSYVDLNGHMNNTRYFDVAEDHLGAAADGKRLLEVQAEYIQEAKLGETLHVAWGEENGRFYLAGSTARPCFKMSLQYAQ